MSAVARRQGRRRLGRPELVAAGRRLARHRRDGRDRRGRAAELPDRRSTIALRVGARPRASPGAVVAVGRDPQDRAPARERGAATGASPRPRDRDDAKQRLTAEERRQAVLDTACRVFSRSSYRGATTAEIAREAGISEPILYRHFGSKRDLYLACLDEAWRELPRGLRAARSPTDPDTCLGAIADAYMAKGAKIRLVDLWIQALTEASEDTVIAAALRHAGARGARLLRRRDPRRPGAAASSTPTATRSPRRGSSSRAACSATMDHRLGGLLGDDLERVRAERHRWMAADRRGLRTPRKSGKPRLRHPGLFLGQAGRRLGDSESLGSAAQPCLRSSRLWRSPCTAAWRRPRCKVRSLYEPGPDLSSNSVK